MRTARAAHTITSRDGRLITAYCPALLQVLREAVHPPGGAANKSSSLALNWPVRVSIDNMGTNLKAHWLLTAWVHAALVLVVVGEIVAISFAQTFLIPRFEKFMAEGWLDPRIREQGQLLNHVLHTLDVMTYESFWLTLGLAVVLFEWRTPRESKTSIRLAGLTTAAVMLTTILLLLHGWTFALLNLTSPVNRAMGERAVVTANNCIDASLTSLDQARKAKDWTTMGENVEQAKDGLTTLVYHFSRAPDRQWTPSAKEQVGIAETALQQAAKAISNQNEKQLTVALEEFRATVAPMRQWAQSFKRESASR